MSSSPDFYRGFVPTPAQWESYFAGKQDALGFAPVNRAGDTMTGELRTAPSTIYGAGLSVPAGIKPADSARSDGDVWMTNVGLFYQMRGVVIGPLTQAKQGVQGEQGEDGPEGWSPVLAIVADGARCVLQVADWFGGEGEKPVGGYVGSTGLVQSIATGIDIRGFPGPGTGTVVHTGTPASGHVAIFGSDGDHIADGGALTAFGQSLMAAANVAAVKTLLAYGVGDVSGAAPLDSAVLTGVPTAPTAAPGTNTTQIATMAAIQAAIAGLINSAPGALDTLKELADAIGDDPNYAATVTNALATKSAKASNLSDLLDKSAARTNLGVAIGYNVQAWDSDLDAIAALGTTSFGRGLLTQTSVATLKTLLAYVVGDVSGAAPLASPALTGVPSAPTAALGTNTTQIATMAALQAALAGSGGGASPSATIATTSGTNVTAAAADKGKVYILVGSATLSLPAAVQTSGWYAFVKKVDGTGVWAITPAGVTIDGLSSINMYSEGSYLIWWDAANGVFRTQGRPKGWITIGTTTIASTVSTLALNTGFTDTELRDMRLVLDGLVSPSTTSDKLAFRVQKNGAYATNAYANVTTTNNASTVSSTYAGAYHLISSAFASYGVFGEIDLPLFASTSALGQRLSAKAFSETLVSDTTDGTHSPGTPGAITAIQIYCVSGQSLSGGVVSQRGYRP